jgi:putative addiction module killer protein
MLPYILIEVRECMAPHGCNPFHQWFEDLDTRATVQVTVALTRLDQGTVFHVNGVGGGVLELRIDYGPGYRYYLGKDGGHMALRHSAR